MTYPPARDFLIQADYIYYLNPQNGPLPELSIRDEMLLNKALITVGPNTKQMLFNTFRQIGAEPGKTYSFWNKLAKFVDRDVWREPLKGTYVDEYRDPLGFDDDLPKQSDLVTGPYPSTMSPPSQPTPPGVYNFYYIAPQPR